MDFKINTERIEICETILKKLEKDEYFDFFDRIAICILIKDYKELLKGKNKNECKKHK